MIEEEALTQIEKDKLTIDPNFDFREIGARPFKDISTNEIGLFKWSGIYHQLQSGYFMMRVRLPGGHLSAAQLYTLGELAERYGQNELCITTRQTLQYHWLRKEDLYKVIEALLEVGVLTTNCCGDVVRNVTTCHLQGVCPYEAGNTRTIINQIDQDPEFLHEQRNLSRKHKIAVSGCDSACGMQLMNCQAWVPIGVDANGVSGWRYYAGGGLGQNPYLAKCIFDWVPEELVLAVTRAGVEAHRRFGNRRHRRLGRLKIIVDNMGAKGYADALFKLMAERNVPHLDQIKVADNPTPNVKAPPFEGDATIAQRQSGLNVVRVMINRSEISGVEAKQFANWSELYGNGELMLTVRQNLQIRGVPDAKVKLLQQAISNAGYRMQGLEHLPDVVACVGTTMCNLAVSDTPNAYQLIVEAFGQDKAFWAQVGPLKINLNGCPNSCAHHWIADIGLRGRREMQHQGSEEGFSLFVGGTMIGPGHIGEFVVDVSVNQIVPTLKKCLAVYLKERKSGAESFGAYTRRIGGKPFADLIAQYPDDQAFPLIHQRNQQLNETFEHVVQEADNE